MTRERVINMIDCILGNDILCDCIEDSTIGCNECRREAADIAINALKKQKTGQWMIEDCHAATYKYCCSECNAHHRARYDFCPTCGCRMECEE